MPLKHQIQKEINFLKEKLSQLDSPVVFCHNDLLLGNVIYSGEENRATFIDYEYSGLNYQAYDIGNHFAEFVGTYFFIVACVFLVSTLARLAFLFNVLKYYRQFYITETTKKQCTAVF